MWAQYVDPTPFDVTHWKIREKINKYLQNNHFDGTAAKYKDWASNVVNHILNSNQGYGKILWLLQRETEPVTYQRLATTNVPGLQVNWFWISRTLYTFLFDVVSPTFQRSLPRRVGKSEEHNGLELWTRMFFEFEGGAVEVEVQERDNYTRFPQCPDAKYLNEYLSEW